MEQDKLQNLVRKVVDELKSGVFDYYSYTTWESIVFPEGYEKPPKEAFEAKLKELIDAQPLKNLRQERNTRLAEVDWVFVEDVQLSDENYKAWVAYRKALRELPSTTEDPENPIWPEKPSIITGPSATFNENTEIKRILDENNQLMAKMIKIEKRLTDQELKLIKLSRRK